MKGWLVEKPQKNPYLSYRNRLHTWCSTREPSKGICNLHLKAFNLSSWKINIQVQSLTNSCMSIVYLSSIHYLQRTKIYWIAGLAIRRKGKQSAKNWPRACNNICCKENSIKKNIGIVIRIKDYNSNIVHQNQKEMCQKRKLKMDFTIGKSLLTMLRIIVSSKHWYINILFVIV